MNVRPGVLGLTPCVALYQILFLVNIAFFATKAIKHPQAFKKSLYDHEDGLFLPCFNLGFATLFVCVLDYAVPYCGFWYVVHSIHQANRCPATHDSAALDPLRRSIRLVRAMMVVWVIYIAVGLFVGMLLEWTIRGRNRDLSTVTPADLLPLFPLMLAGTLGSGLCSKLPLDQAGYVIIVSYMLQSTGWWLGLLKCVFPYSLARQAVCLTLRVLCVEWPVGCTGT